MKLVKKKLNESMEGKYCIVAVKPDGSRVFYKDGDFVDSAKDCTVFTDHDEAIDVWYDIDKSAFRRVFVPNWSENLFESADMNKRCEKCNTPLNDGGTCPKCDDGEEDYSDEDTELTEQVKDDALVSPVDLFETEFNKHLASKDFEAAAAMVADLDAGVAEMQAINQKRKIFKYPKFIISMEKNIANKYRARLAKARESASAESNTDGQQ